MPLKMLAIAAAAVAILAAGTFTASAEDPFYKGKRLTLLINFAPGGPTDIEGRLFARHVVKHIDGNPSLVVQNKDGAGGVVGSVYLGELGPKDGTMVGYLTGATWNYVVDPKVFRVDFRTYQFIGYQPGNAVYYVRSDTPPGMHDGTDIMKAQGLVVGGLGADSSKDLLLRLTFDMLGLQYRYITGYRSSNTARLAVQNGEINVHSETTPAYFSIVEPSLVKTGKVIPTWYDANYNGKEFVSAAVMEHTKIPTFTEFYQKVKGSAPSGPLLEAYKTNLLVDSDMLRTIAMPPGVPQAAVDAMRKAVEDLNNDKDYAADAMKTIQFVPHYVVNPNLNDEVGKALTISPEMRTFITSYMKKVAK
jgi:tripartite-type tricarboxylate transporter receptor subunit TctC